MHLLLASFLLLLVRHLLLLAWHLLLIDLTGAKANMGPWDFTPCLALLNQIQSREVGTILFVATLL